MTKRVIVLTGRGSGGHFYPLMAVAEELNKQASPENHLTLHYLGPKPYNQEVLQKNQINFVQIPSGKKTKYFSLGNLFTPFKILWGLIVALQKLYFIYPDVVFSKGSYTSVPVILAAAFLRIPIVIHESDTQVGSANKLATRFARYIAIAYDDVAQFFPSEKTALVGIPLRQDFLAPQPDAANALGIPTDKLIILVTGGSLGAQRINELLLNSLDELLPHYTIIHQTGADNEESVRQSSASLISDKNLLGHYYVRGSLTTHDMNLAMSAAHLIISRAGSGTIFEIAAKNKPAIIIPIPEAISHDQRTNAFAYARSGAASVLEEENFTDDLLSNEINRIMGDQNVYANMAKAAEAFACKDAGQTIAKTIIDIANEH